MRRLLASPLLAASVLLQACAPAPKPAEPIRAVKVMQVGESEVTSSNSYAGEIKARIESRLGFRVGGKLVARHVELGQKVRAGQL